MNRHSLITGILVTMLLLAGFEAFGKTAVAKADAAGSIFEISGNTQSSTFDNVDIGYNGGVVNVSDSSHGMLGYFQGSIPQSRSTSTYSLLNAYAYKHFTASNNGYLNFYSRFFVQTHVHIDTPASGPASYDYAYEVYYGPDTQPTVVCHLQDFLFIGQKQLDTSSGAFDDTENKWYSISQSPVGCYVSQGVTYTVEVLFQLYANPPPQSVYVQGISSTSATSLNFMSPGGCLTVSYSSAPVNGCTLDDALFLSQSAPSSLCPGQTSSVSVEFQNLGAIPWQAGSSSFYRLDSWNPADNTNWGTQTVTLSQDVSPAGIFTAGGDYTFNFAITAPAQSGTYNFQWRMVYINIFGQYNYFGTPSQNLQITVQSPSASQCMKDFTLTAGIGPTSFNGGTSVGYYVYATGLNGFSATVSLSVNTPNGVSCTMSQTSISPGLLLGSTVACTSGMIGSYTVDVTGTSSSLSHSIALSIIVSDASVLAFGAQGISIQGTVTLWAAVHNGGATTLGSSDWGVKFYANSSIIGNLGGIPSAQGQTLNITMNWRPSITGNYTLSVSVSPLTFVDVNLQNNAMSIQATYFAYTSTFSGVKDAVYTVFTRSTPTTKTAFGTLTLAETDVTSSAVIISSSTPLVLADNATGNFVFQTPNAPFWLASACSIKTNMPSTCSFQRTPDVNYDGGKVDIVDGAALAFAFDSVPGSQFWDPKSDLDGDGRVNIVDSAYLAAYFGWPVIQINPSLVSLSATSPAFLPGSSGSSVVTVNSQNGWAGSLSLTQSVAPVGPSCLFGTSDSSSLFVVSGRTGSVPLTCSASLSVVPGIYDETVAGSNGSLGNSVTFPIYVSGFTISATTPVNFNVNSGSSTTVSLTSIFRFVGNVSLSTSTSPATGLIVSCPASVRLSSGQVASTTCSLKGTQTGIYTVTVTGTSGGFSYNTTVTVSVQDFKVSSSPSSFSLIHGSDRVVGVSLSSISGWSGNVTLQVTSIDGRTLQVTSIDGRNLCATWTAAYTNCNSGTVTLTLGPNGTGSANLHIGSYSGSTKTIYNISVSAFSGSLVHATTIAVTVTT